MALDTIVDSLQPSHRYALANLFIRKAMPLWDNFVTSDGINYVDSVVGMSHHVSADALSRAMLIVNEAINSPGSQAKNLAKLKHEFMEYSVALQDGDFDVPEPLKLLFYAVENFILKMTGQEISVYNESQIYLVINQAIDALVSSKSMNYQEVNDVIAVYQ